MNKRNKVIVILGVLFIIAAIVFIILGFALSGADILAWFGSKWAMWLYVFAGVYVLILIYLLISERIKNL